MKLKALSAAEEAGAGTVTSRLFSISLYHISFFSTCLIFYPEPVLREGSSLAFPHCFFFNVQIENVQTHDFVKCYSHADNLSPADERGDDDTPGGAAAVGAGLMGVRMGVR